MTRRRASLLTVVVLLGLLAAPAAAVSVDPRFEAYVPEPATLEPGQEAVVTVQLLNDAPDVEDTARTARQVRATMTAGDSPVEVRSGTRLVGDLADGVPREVQFRLSVPRDAAPGTYRLPVDLRYEFDNQDERSRVTVPVEVEALPRFRIVAAGTTAAIGETGTLELTLANVGTAPAHDATVVVESPDAELSFGAGAARSEGFVGRWAPGETKQVSYRLQVAASAVQRNYAVRATVQYEDDDGQARTAALATGVEPRPRQTFAVRDLTSTLAVGSTGSVEATLVNTGEATVRDAVVVIDVEGTTLAPRAVEYPVGDLAPGASTPVSFTIDVPDTAVPGDRRLGLVVRYENAAGDTSQSEPLGIDAPVSDRHVAFSVRPVQASFPVDSTGRLVVALANDLDEPISDVTVGLTVAPPLESEDAAAFVGPLEAGESSQLAFKLEVTDEAIEKSYPVQLDVSYRDAAGTLKEAGPYRVGVTVTPAPDAGLPVLPIAAVVVAVAVAALWWYRRR